MSYELRDNSGTMFRNKRKERDSHPDWSGDILVNGQTMWINAWEKKDKNGNTFYSIAFKNKQVRQKQRDDPDSIPF